MVWRMKSGEIWKVGGGKESEGKKSKDVIVKEDRFDDKG